MAQDVITKAEIIEQARNLGAEFVGFAPAECWGKFGDVPIAGHPQTIWPQTKTVIVLEISSLPVTVLPVALGLEGWNVANELLDAAAYRLAVFLNCKGYPSVNIPLDSSGENIPEHKTVSVFSHFWAGYYAGISQTSPKDNPEMLSRLKVTSVLTSLDWDKDYVE